MNILEITMMTASVAQDRSRTDEVHHDRRGASERARRAALASHAHHRRRRIDPTTCDKDYSVAEIEFMGAIQAYKSRSGVKFPHWGAVLDVLMTLGYRKSGSVPTAS